MILEKNIKKIQNYNEVIIVDSQEKTTSSGRKKRTDCKIYQKTN